MDKIAKEIEEMANKMEKSTQDPKESLFNIIKSLGPEGIRAKLPTLTDDDKILLKAALEEMNLNKAVEFDKEAQSAKVIQGKVTDTIIQEEIASDDADEKLMKPAAAVQNHQGTPTDGWQGQVIKSGEDMNKSQMEMIESNLDLVIEKAMEKCNDDKMVMKKLKEKGMDEGKVQGALDKYKQKKMKKSQDDEIEKGKMKERDQAKEKIMQMEEKEHGTKNPKKLVQDEKKEHSMKKAEDGTDTYYVRATVAGVEQNVQITKSQYDELEKAQKMNKEEDQCGDVAPMNEKPMGKKTAAPNIEDNAKANKKNMTKSASWDGDDRLFKSNSLGRNHSFNLENFVTETLKTQPQEEIKKSETKKEDLNDIIEKGGDCTWDQLNHDRLMSQNKQSGLITKSFADADLAQALGVSLDECKKILGE